MRSAIGRSPPTIQLCLRPCALAADPGAHHATNSARAEYVHSASKTGATPFTRQRFPNMEGRESAMTVSVLRDTNLNIGLPSVRPTKRLGRPMPAAHVFSLGYWKPVPKFRFVTFADRMPDLNRG
jgi:hypothetical protein